jgi:anthranilate/para-aminobenzoate synthase component II
MTSVILYGNQQLSPVFDRYAFQEVNTHSLQGLVQCVKEYGVEDKEIFIAENAEILAERLKDKQREQRKVTLIIPGGYSLLIDASLESAKTHELIDDMIQAGQLNCFGVCAGMDWMLNCVVPSRKGGGYGFFFKYVSAPSFQKSTTAGSSHLLQDKAPVVIPSTEEDKPFQAFWNSGGCAYFEGDPKREAKQMQAVTSIAKYTKEELFTGEQFQKAYRRLGYFQENGAIPPERYPHAGIMRITEKKSVLVGIGFHPEIPLDPQKLTLGISPEENNIRVKRFLFSIFDRLELSKTVVAADHLALRSLNMD